MAEEQQEDGGFQLWCNLEDLNDVRAFITDSWKEYTRGHLTPDAAGRITNVGFMLMRRASEDFTKSHPEFGDYWSVLEILNLQLVAEGRMAALDPVKANGQYPQGRERADAVTLLCTSGVVSVQAQRNRFVHELSSSHLKAAENVNKANVSKTQPTLEIHG